MRIRSMKRLALEKLIRWKDSFRRKPLLLLGARQVGKTWLMREFGRLCFEHVAYVRFDSDQKARSIFKDDFDMKRILDALQLLVGLPIESGKTLLILDEIQECPAALTSLKYFCEDVPELHVVAAGSLLGVEVHEGTGFPVGKVNQMMLYPMSFTEFLRGIGREQFADALQSRDWTLVNTFHSTFAELLRRYYYIGGMPEVVDTFRQTENYALVREVQEELLASYQRDFSKHVSVTVSTRIAQIWKSLPSQLSRENKKFIYKDVHPDIRRRNATEPMEWLLHSGLIHHNNRVKEPRIPFSAYEDGVFKAFVVDIGLLGAMCRLPAALLLEKNRVFGEYKGALTEQYVLQQLLAEFGAEPYYWANESARSEIDFLLEDEQGVIPLEAKAEQNLRAKSLFAFCSKFNISKAVRTSMHPYERQEITLKNGGICELLDLPLYALSQLRAELSSPPAK